MKLRFLPVAASGGCKSSSATIPASSQPASATLAATFPTQRTAIMERTRKRSRSSSIREDRLSTDPRVLFPDPRSDNAQSSRQRPRHQLSIRHLLYERRAKRVAEETVADVNASGLWPGKVVTELAPAGPFWEAEPEHQDYLQKYPAATRVTSYARVEATSACKSLEVRRRIFRGLRGK